MSNNGLTATTSATSHATLDLRAQPKVYVVFALLLGIPGAAAVTSYFQGKPEFRLALVVLGAALLAVVWLRSYRLRLSPQRLEYQSLFGGKHAIALGDIERAHTEYKRKGSGPTHGVVITPTARSGVKRFVINVPIFAPQDMRVLHERLAVEPLPDE